jgi:hypothetical protein
MRLIMSLSKEQQNKEIYPWPLFSLIQCNANAQYVSKLNRYFNQVVGDFGPHQTIPVLTSLSPSPPFNPAGSSSSDNYLLRRFPHFLLAPASGFFTPYDRLKREQRMCFSFMWYSILSLLNGYLANERLHFLRTVHCVSTRFWRSVSLCCGRAVS